VTTEWRKLHSEGHKNLNFSLDIIKVIISRTMRFTGHIARIERIRKLIYIFSRKT
jgi:hypothetical protein